MSAFIHFSMTTRRVLTARFQDNLNKPVPAGQITVAAIDDGSAGDAGEIWNSMTKLLNHHHQHKNQFLTGQMPFLCPNTAV